MADVIRVLDRDDLATLDATALLERPQSLGDRLVGIRLLAVTATGALWTLWLWVRQKRTCWYFKALHEYECWVTTGEAPDSPRHAVDELSLHIRRDRDGADYWHVGHSTAYWAKSDEIWHSGGACGRSIVSAKATYQGVSWSTDQVVIE